ncbi:acetyl-CoA synthetase-like protein [Xylaria palmicola]|nr:acetyl-CoA synthetase-like protein [Xylaria palmicola]
MSQLGPPRNDIPPVFQLSHASTERLIHLIPDELAEAVPEHPLFSFSKTENPRDGFRDVSARCFANAINRTAWWLEENLGRPSDFETVAYIGSNDIRYLLFLFAAIKVGYKMLFTSPRNNLDAHLNVLEKTDCRIFLSASDAHTDVQPILDRRPMLRTLTVPTLDALLAPPQVTLYPYTKGFGEARRDPCLVLHTTGSTGLPKPVVWRNAMLTTYEAWRLVPRVGDYVPTTEVYQRATRAYTSMPLFHTSGINAAITWALCLGVTLVYGDPHVPPNPAYVAEMHRFAGVDATMGAPSIYEELSSREEWLEGLKNMCYVVASGAPLSHKAGSIISKYSRVIGNLGATETANLPRLAPAPEDWEYFYWHPTHSGIELRPDDDAGSGSGLHELFIVRAGDAALAPFQGVFHAFPQLEEWSMNDLYDRHPDPARPFLWRYRGRRDDVVVLSNGEKIMPALMEAAVAACPRVRGAMVVGHGRFHPVVLVELAEGVTHPGDAAAAREEILRELAPFIEDANKLAPAHARLDPRHVVFADPGRLIHYLGQGKIQRRRTYQEYEEAIAAAYRDIEAAAKSADGPRELRLAGHDETVAWLRRVAVGVGVPPLDPADDFFRAGVDSLQVMRMARAIAGGVAATDIYRHHSLDALAGFLLARQDASPSPVNSEEEEEGDGVSSVDTAPTEVSTADIDDMRALLASCAADLPRRPRDDDGAGRQMTVVLTGSTGSLGSYLLDTLYRAPAGVVARIVCLNRAADGRARQARASAARGLAADWDPGRVAFLRADLAAPFLGLAPGDYLDLVEGATHVLHNQWPVNFHWRVASFAPFVRGVRNLADLCLGSRRRAVLLFVSSVSAVGAWEGKGPVPEEPVEDLNCAAMGYGQAKLVSERLLHEAAVTSGLRAAVCRVGVVAGPVERWQGMWNRHEYIPALINSSVYLGCFPTSFPSRDNIDWLPVDKVARVLVEILESATSTLESSAESQLPVYHVANPHAISWSNIVPWAIDGLRLKPVSFEEWLGKLDSRDEPLEDVDQNPAIKLVEFYRRAGRTDVPRRMATWRAAQASRTLREVGPVNKQWMMAWLKQWGLA